MKQRITYITLTIIVLIFLVVFTLQNINKVTVSLLFWDIKMSLSLLIFSLFSLGVLTTIFILTPIIIALKSTFKEMLKLLKN
ncbi:lipopolysaccharide assembly protein LapA domain-containing protein [Algibacter sp. L4_22]|uniref:lipopolysaccharide assembly protein LapA domain-containing protein n=1 Tax=Algibacter sp. L4_22 TaxID=2942477 RepID=UPI00201B8598|nr:lipopolysaccharide assembly protein LapA domain-containing protein [Algibacter sp. L4_22]MCL5129288.1 lipopolysaccharide assembly protein LapA domain-containing protein [Algibacter sp. L4_22]